jgi:prevent-host-death family protein
MNEIGLFEAKTKFSEICEEVATKHKAVVITRRGKPLVRIGPVSEGRREAASVWGRRAKYEERHGRATEDFLPPRRAKQIWRSPLDE